MKKLSFLGICLIPFTSLPVMPSTYRPITVLFLLLPGALYFLSAVRRKELPDKLLFIFTIYIGIYSFFRFSIFDSGYVHLAEGGMILFLGVTCYYGFNYAFENLDYKTLFKSFQVLVNVFLLVATLDIVLFLLGDIFGLRTMIFSLIADKVAGRPQYTTSEAAWAAQITLFLIPVQTWISQKTNDFKDKLKVGYLYLLVILTLSLLGYVLLIIYLSVIYVFKNKSKIRAIAEIGFVIVFTASMIYGTLLYFSGKGNNYTLSRIQSFTSKAEWTVIYDVDASAYIRTLYPKVGYDIFVDYPLGVGIGGYSVFFGDYITRYDYEMLQNSETQWNIREKNADPKNVYSKLLSEFGIVNTLFFAILVFMIARKKGNFYKHSRSTREFLFSLNTITALVFLQFSSLVYVPFWFCLSLNKNYDKLTKRYKLFRKDE